MNRLWSVQDIQGSRRVNLKGSQGSDTDQNQIECDVIRVIEREGPLVRDGLSNGQNKSTDEWDRNLVEEVHPTHGQNISIESPELGEGVSGSFVVDGGEGGVGGGSGPADAEVFDIVESEGSGGGARSGDGEEVGAIDVGEGERWAGVGGGVGDFDVAHF